MTVKEVNKLYYLNKLIKRDEEQIEKLEAEAQGLNAPIGETSHTAPHDRLQNAAIALMQAKKRLKKRKAQYDRIKTEIEKGIARVDNPLIQLILSYRLVDLMRWDEIAAKIGGNNTADSVKHIFYRFIRRL